MSNTGINSDNNIPQQTTNNVETDPLINTYAGLLDQLSEFVDPNLDDQELSDAEAGYASFLEELNNVIQDQDNQDSATPLQEQAYVDFLNIVNETVDSDIAEGGNASNLTNFLNQVNQTVDNEIALDDVFASTPTDTASQNDSLNDDLNQVLQLFVDLGLADNLDDAANQFLTDDLLQQLDPSTQQPITQNDASQDEFFDQITDLISGVGDVNTQNALNSAFANYQNAIVEFQGALEQNAINTETNEISNELDNQLLQLRQNYLILSKQLEQYTLDQQTQEQIRNTMFTIQFNQTQNLFQLAKTVANAAKF